MRFRACIVSIDLLIVSNLLDLPQSPLLGVTSAAQGYGSPPQAYGSSCASWTAIPAASFLHSSLPAAATHPPASPFLHPFLQSSRPAAASADPDPEETGLAYLIDDATARDSTFNSTTSNLLRPAKRSRAAFPGDGATAAAVATASSASFELLMDDAASVLEGDDAGFTALLLEDDVLGGPLLL